MELIQTLNDLTWFTLMGVRLIVADGGSYSACPVYQAKGRRVVARISINTWSPSRVEIKRATEPEKATLTKWMANWN